MDSTRDESASDSACGTTGGSIIYYAPVVYNIHGAGQKRASVTSTISPPASKRANDVDPRMAAQMGHFSLAHFSQGTSSKCKNVTGSKCKIVKAKNPPADSSSIGSASVLEDVVKELKSKFPALIVEPFILGRRRWAIVRGMPNMEPSIDSPIYSPRMVVSVSAEDTVCFKFEAMFVTIAKGVLPADHHQFYKWIQSLCPDSGYFMCEGIPFEVATLMDYQTKNIRKWEFPFRRLDHNNCEMWLYSPTPTSTIRRCRCCSNLMYYVKREAKKQHSVTPEEKAARVNPSSHFPIKYLSPAKQEERRNSVAKERKALQRQVKQLGANDVNADNTTDGNTS